MGPAKVDEWLTSKVPLILGEFSPENIFNADETAFFWKMFPDKTMSFKKDDTRGGKLPKERITVLLCASTCGEKAPPLIIGKSAKPRSFPPNVSALPFKYTNNNKAWMTSILFDQWLRKFDSELNRKIALILDNCPAHPHVEDLSNITLIFLPPNTTPLMQPH